MWLSALLVGVLVPFAQAGQFNVAPVKVTLPARAKSTAVTITNTGKQPVALRIKLYTWNKQTGRDQLTPAEDLVVTPPILKLAPGRSQIVRIGRPAEIAVPGIEKSYRLLVTELALPDEKRSPGAGLTLRSLLELSIPLFVPPANATKQLEWRLSAGASDDQLILNALNTGTVHSKVTQLRLLDSAGSLVAEHAQMFYVLPQQESRPPLTLLRKPRAGETLKLEYRADNAPRAAEFKAPGR